MHNIIMLSYLHYKQTNRKMINMYEIVKMPKPMMYDEKYQPLKEALRKLEVGDSIVVNTEKERNLCLMYSKRNLGINIITEKMKSGKYQIYREQTADYPPF